jgi:hypothetical protein
MTCCRKGNPSPLVWRYGSATCAAMALISGSICKSAMIYIRPELELGEKIKKIPTLEVA